jgi:hypothetical protein
MYNALEVTGHDVNILMPQIIAVKHQLFLDKFFKTGKEKVINKESELFAMPRSGYVIAISAIMKPVPSLKDDIQYISLIRRRHQEYDYLITNEQGRIDCASEGISGHLHLQPNFLKENEVYIQFLCPELLDMVSTAEGMVTKLETCQGFCDLNFIVPANFATVIQNFAKNPSAAQHTESATDEDHTGDNTAADKPTEESMLISTIIKPNDGLKKPKGKIPEIVKKIWYMIHGTNFSTKTGLAKNILSDYVTHTKFEVRRTWRVEVYDKVFGDGALKLKVFKFAKDKTREDQTEKSSERFYNVQRSHSRTRAAPEALERLKSVGLDPQSSSHMSRVSKEDDKKKLGDESVGSGCPVAACLQQMMTRRKHQEP